MLVLIALLLALLASFAAWYFVAHLRWRRDMLERKAARDKQRQERVAASRLYPER